MKKIIFLFALTICFHSSFAQNKMDSLYLDKVKSIDAIIETLYGVISGEKGEERNWELFRYLYQDGAQLVPSGTAKDGTYKLQYNTPDDYIEKSGKWLIENGFYEKEINREVQQFGNIAHVFSTYECFKRKDDTEPFMRGINSIQLLYDNNRWWVVNIYWSQESKSNPIPEGYLPIEEEQLDISYNAEKAAEYGADDYGMKKYIIAYLKKGPNRDLDSAAAMQLQIAHMNNIDRMADEGKLVLAGPFFGDGEVRGIYVFNVKTIEEAKALTETDPAIKAGSLTMELVEWYGSAALMEVNDIHKSLMKMGITEE